MRRQSLDQPNSILMPKLTSLGLIIAIVGPLASAPAASAQGYDDVTSDGYTVWVDSYDDAPFPGSASCPYYTTIADDLNGVLGSGSAYYPGTAHVSVAQARYDSGVTHQFQRTVTHYGEQRGGKCGPTLSKIVIVQFEWAITFTQSTTTTTDSAGRCSQALACTNTTNPQCDITSTVDGTGPGQPCDAYHETISFVWARTCLINISAAAGGPGQCTVAQ